MKTLSIVMITTIFAIGVSSCAGNSPVGQPDLEGVTWVLTSYNESRPIEGTQLTIQFKDGQVSGNAGCNHYGGSYQIKGDAIVFADLFNTERACMEPKGVMEQEQIYIDLLRASQRFELADGVLTIFADSHQFLTFEIQQANLIISTPAVFKEYKNSLVSLSIYTPGSWMITRIDEDPVLFSKHVLQINH